MVPTKKNINFDIKWVKEKRKTFIIVESKQLPFALIVFPTTLLLASMIPRFPLQFGFLNILMEYITHHWKCQLAKKKELLIPHIWGCCGPTGGSIFTPRQIKNPAFFEGRLYKDKMAHQIWAELVVCLSSYF